MGQLSVHLVKARLLGVIASGRVSSVAVRPLTEKFGQFIHRGL
jgi:hypothetical protein